MYYFYDKNCVQNMIIHDKTSFVTIVEYNMIYDISLTLSNNFTSIDNIINNFYCKLGRVFYTRKDFVLSFKRFLQKRPFLLNEIFNITPEKILTS